MRSLVLCEVANRQTITPLMRSMYRVLLKNVFSVRQKQSICMSGSRKFFRNKSHVVGPATAKVWRPYVSSWNRGTTRRWRLAGRRCCLSATWATGVQIIRRLAMQALVYRHPKLIWDSICHIEPRLRVKQVCHAAVVLLRTAQNSRCSVHDLLQHVANKLWCSGQQQILQ